MNHSIHPNDALVIVDPQNDFCPGGKLAVKGGDKIMKKIAKLSALFRNVVVTQDWHPAGHKSFASSHPGAEPFSQVVFPYGPQVLWPDHCIQGSEGAEFHPDILPAVQRANAIIRKGMNPDIDSYSAFLENDKVTMTGLGGYLRIRRVRRLFFVGLAYDFCVGFSAIDGMGEGFETVVIKDLTRAIAMPVGNTDTVAQIEDEFKRMNVQIANLKDIKE